MEGFVLGVGIILLGLGPVQLEPLWLLEYLSWLRLGFGLVVCLQGFSNVVGLG